MSVIVRGVKNSVRNPARSGAVVALLGVATALALSLLLANQAVKTKIEDLKTTGATTLTIMPAGAASGFGAQGGGEPLSDTMFEEVRGLEHVADSGATLGGGFRRATFGGPVNGGSGSNTSVNFTPPESDIDLESPVSAGTIGRRAFGNGAELEDVPDFKLPVQATGVSGNLDQNGNNYVLTAGDWFRSDDGYQAVLGKDLASHNNLSVGSTFTGYDDQTFTVIGIYDAEDTFRNASVLLPLETFQTLSEQPSEISSILVKVDSIEHIESVEAAITEALGEDTVDVSSSAQGTVDAINSLESIQRVSIAGVVIAIAAAGVIVFMVMVMIVRERKKEIAVLKAIGGSNLKITGQFVTEAVVLTIAAVLIGALIALAGSNSITDLLITTNTADSSATTETDSSGTAGFGGPGTGGFRQIVGGPAAAEQETAEDLLSDVRTDVGAGFIVQGLLAVVLIGALGSAIPAYAISKVRPAEVLRSE